LKNIRQKCLIYFEILLKYVLTVLKNKLSKYIYIATYKWLYFYVGNISIRTDPIQKLTIIIFVYGRFLYVKNVQANSL